jgi:lysine 2,3-aminomutase
MPANRDIRLLKDQASAQSGDNENIKLVTKRYAVSITDHVRTAMYADVETDPVAKQYVPQPQELITLPEENADPIGDETHTPVKGIVHRYPDRVLFKPVSVCAVYCRYCFRREMIGPQAGVLSAQERAAALAYIQNTPQIWEVILSGGDPMILSPRQMKTLMQGLADIAHVKTVRIHTRLPAADPARITEDLADALMTCGKAVYLVVHINHPQEITDDVRLALRRLHRAGINLLSQSVLLKGVNNDARTLEDLFRELVAVNVKPYYLHHPDLAPGTSHFRLSIAEGQKIIRTLLGRLSGLALPTYMLDIPGGMGKIPLTPCYLEALPSGGYRVEDYQGENHIYVPHTEQIS